METSRKKSVRNAESGRVKVLFLLIGLVLAAGIGYAVTAIGAKNGAITRQEHVDKTWADIDAELERRLALIPNLVETVKGAANFEQETLTAVTDARASVGQARIQLGSDALANPDALQNYMSAQQGLGTALSRLMVVAERYPELKATQNFADFQHQLEGTENRIKVARQDFNTAVGDYNAFIRKIPNAWFLDAEEFSRRPLFDAAPEAAEVPEVDFGGGA